MPIMSTPSPGQIARVPGFRDLHEFLVWPDGYVTTCAHSDAVVWCDRRVRVECLWAAAEHPRIRDRLRDIR
jgi:hypothetical protein